jgi:hypothetical protein
MLAQAIRLALPARLPGSGNCRRAGRLPRRRTRTVNHLPLRAITRRHSAPATAHAPGKRKAILRIAAAGRQASEARIAPRMRPRKQLGFKIQIVRRGHAGIRSRDPLAARPHGLRRPTTTATGQTIPTTTALTNRRSAHTARRSGPTTLRSVHTATRQTTGIAATRSLALTIRRPRAHIRRRDPIPHRAPATQLHRAPTPHLATAIAAAEVAVAVVALAAVEAAVAAIVAAGAVVAAATPAEAPLLTAIVNFFVNSAARPDFLGGPFVFHDRLQMKSS